MKNQTTLARLKSLVFAPSPSIAMTPEEGEAGVRSKNEQLLQSLVTGILDQEQATDCPGIKLESRIRNHQLYYELAQITSAYGAPRQLCNFRAHDPEGFLRATTKDMRDALKRHLAVMLQLLLSTEQHENFSETLGDA